jgi:hypothetical protein
MSYGLDSQDSIPGKGKGFSPLHSVQTGSGAHPVFYPMGTGGSFPGVNRPGRETDHSSNAEVKNGGAIPPHPHPASWHGAYVIKEKIALSVPLLMFYVM